MRFLSAEQLKALSPQEAQRYCEEIRGFLVENVTRSGGHLASNLGIVEISTALIRVFMPEKDRILYDTGHQSYVHKILTGRGEAFSSLRSLGGISGFPSRMESPADPFGTGHSGTGISAALGFARAARLLGEDTFSVAVIGDGSFSGGMVFEALNNVSHKDRLIIILNDNQMSISRSVGSLKGAFSRMRGKRYYHFKGGVRKTLLTLPGGAGLARFAKKMKDFVKRGTIPQGNLFEQYGLNYFGPADGNDLETVEFLLREAIKKDRPSILHLCTKKGKGYPAAEEDPSHFHGISPAGKKSSGEKSFSALFGDCLCRLAEEDPDLLAITAAMQDGVGLKEFARRFPDRMFDVGIAEEHAMTFAAALSAAGKKPVFAVYSTFFQRAFDQFLHDAALQGLAPVVCLDRAGFSGEDGATHHGLFDLAMTLPIPNVSIYAPLSQEEMESALRQALSRRHAPSVIRYPKGCPDETVLSHFPCREEIEEAVFSSRPPRLCLVSFGRTVKNCIEAAERLQKKGIDTRVVRFSLLKGFDPALLSRFFGNDQALLLVEEGIRQGGFSQYLLSQLDEYEIQRGKTKICAVNEAFYPHGKISELLSLAGLDTDAIVKEGMLLATP